MRNHSGVFSVVLSCIFLSATHCAEGQSYRVERVASGLQQPVYMDQAPGDPSNIIYYMTRVTSGGGNAGNGTHGSLWRYDMNTRQSTEVLNLSHRNLTLDLGPQGFAFHPDFNNPGTDGFQKIYVSSAATGGPVNYVEEYAASGPNGTVPVSGGLPVVNRTLLQYNNVFGDNNHVIDWIGFDPRAYDAAPGSPERNYLYISAGDGSNGRPADQRPEQKSNIVQGKLLRIDVDPNKPDFYPADPQKNFAIPDSNPIPLWNSQHVGNELVGTTLNYTGPTATVSYTPALPEIYFTGTRNTFRMSMDKQTGDFWSGDVGEFQREEINFLPADPYDGTQAPYDFGFPQREGTSVFVTRASGDTSIQWDLAGGGSISTNSINPIQEGPHAALNNGSSAADAEIRSTSRSAYIGGYVYRGP
ncbi:MAG: PQQ-dependent sugar dehydrogenase, partial [Planctomycetales bacterium]|nr:PQQ-dependent sugar dehydrogenase [Planctomycetales bacterium]